MARGVSIAGVRVGGMTPAVARELVRLSFATPVVLTHLGRMMQRSPAQLGALAYVEGAVARARRAAPGTRVPLKVRVRGERVRTYVAALAERFERSAADSRLSLRGVRPYVTESRDGQVLDRPGTTKAIVTALLTSRREVIRLRIEPLRATVTRSTIGPAVVIRRGSNRLELYDGMQLRRSFGVATGQSSYPTPLGHFSIVVMWTNPWWYPPSSDWAKGQKPVPPGPGNPLGTRWMGISSPAVGIHGTPDAASIGYSASHGCIRMRIPDAEYLFTQVRVGTSVFIVSA